MPRSPDWLRSLCCRIWSGDNLGRHGERVAARFLRRQGLLILARNVRLGRGEIDLVAREGTTLVFVEVKSRTHGTRSEMTGLERLDAPKRRTLRRTCAEYRRRYCPDTDCYRLDAVTVEFSVDGRRRRVMDVRWYPAVADLDS